MSLLNKLLKPGGKAGWNAVDVTAGDLYCVSVSPPAGMGSKPVVRGCSKLSAADLDENALHQFAASTGSAELPWALSLDRKNYQILVIEEPSVRSDEMEHSVRWGISSMIDYPAEDAVVSWMKIPTEKVMPNRVPHIYVAVARKQAIENYRHLFKQANLPLVAVDIRETAHRNIATVLSQAGEGAALLSISQRGVQFTVSFQGELYLDRYVEERFFGDDLDDTMKDRALERLIIKAQRSLDFIGRTLPFIDINRLLLAPSPHDIGLKEKIAEHLPIPVESFDLGSIFDFSNAPELRAPESQSRYFVALGASLRFMDGQI